jgi:hypothetical protein
MKIDDYIVLGALIGFFITIQAVLDFYLLTFVWKIKDNEQLNKQIKKERKDYDGID